MKYIKVYGCKSCPFSTHEYYRRRHFILDEDELNSYGKECPLDDKLKE